MTYLFGLHERVAVVTGGRGRLGSVWCRALMDAGCHVLPLDLPEYDVRQRADMDRAAGIFKGVDVLVLAAGIDTPPAAQTWELNMSFGPRMTELAPTTIGVFAVNVLGAITTLEAFLPVLRPKASIIFVGSLYGSVSPDPSLYNHLGFDKPPSYGASKAAVASLARHYAVRLASQGIRVNTLSPGGVRGDQDEEFQRRYASHVPLGRMADVDDLIGPLLFLASDASRYVTGHELRVDGGFTAL